MAAAGGAECSLLVHFCTKWTLACRNISIASKNAAPADLLPFNAINTIVIFWSKRRFLIEQTKTVCPFNCSDLRQEACRPFVDTLPACVPSLVGLVAVQVVAEEAGQAAVAGRG